MLEKLKQPQVLILLISLAVQALEYYGVIVPPELVSTLNDLVTLIAGGVVAYKSQENSLV